MVAHIPPLCVRLIGATVRNNEQARSGEIKNMTGIGSPYEAPLSPDLVLDTGTCSVVESTDRLLEHLRAAGYLQPPAVSDGVAADSETS